jgi:NAD(P)-dependent dehydrogenase (short-subunit alcohol dehydrogenase family)
MASPISGKTVLITGASRGIGLELLKQLLSKGNHVIAAVRSPKTAAALHQLPPAEAGHASAQRAKLSLVQLDVSDPQSMEAAIEELLALLVNRHIDVSLARLYGRPPEHPLCHPLDQRLPANLSVGCHFAGVQGLLGAVTLLF